MNDPTDRDREMAREWLSDGHGDCYRYEPREDEAGETVDSLAALIARAREEGRREETQHLRTIVMKRVFGPANVAYEYAYHADKYSMDTQTTREIGQEWVQAGKWVQ